jgi:HAE1 family hydrophobic/amphiphilic exporter-1
MTITELSIKRPSLVIVVFTALLLVGIYALQLMNYELLPKITPPVITITTIYPGASPNEVETNVTKQIEDAVSGLDKIDEVRSTSQEGLSFVVVQLLQSANIDISLQDAQRKVNEIVSRLPSGSKAPTISKIAFDEIPVIRMGVSSNLNSKEFYTFLKDKIKPAISKISGVGQVALIGGQEREVKINLDHKKLKSYGLSVLQVMAAVKSSNLDFPTGSVKDVDQQYVVRVAGKFNSIDELRNLAIGSSRQGGEIKLSDVSEVQDGVKDAVNYTRINNKPTVSMQIQKQTDANAVEVSKLVRKELANLEVRYKSLNLKFTIAQDGSLFTIDAANAVKTDLAIAVVLVALVMLLFLHSIRNSVIVLIAIPSSLITTFAVMYAFGFTLNLMTLLGLSLVVGILVDDSIVVLENIYHHLEKGEERKTAALKGRNEIGFAALAITFVDVAVFLPLALVGGIVGNIMRQFSVVVVVSTLLSLFVSFTITPMLASRFAKLERQKNTNAIGRFVIWFESKFHILTEDYVMLLKWSFNNRWKVGLGSFLLFTASLTLVPLGFIGGEFMTQTDRGEFAVTIELPPGAKLEQTNSTSQYVERIINQMPEVEKTFVTAGVSNEGFVGFASNNVSEINVTLVPREERTKTTDEVSDEIKLLVQKIPGVKVRVNPIGIFGTANQTPIQINVSGTNIDEVFKAAKIVEDVVKSVPGSTDVRSSSEEGKPETRIEVDREKLNSLGLTIADVGTTLRIALTGDDESKFRDGQNEYDIRIQLDEFDRSKTDNIGSLTVMNKKGQLVELNQFANISLSTGPTKLQRQGRNPSITIYAQAVGRPIGSISQDIDNILKKTKLPGTTSYLFGGDFKNQRESFGTLFIALFAALIFTYMIMVALYDNFIYPFIIFFSIPLAMIGALLALALTMKSLSIFTMLGIIMLIGLVGKNAILLVDRANSKRAEGESVHDALIDAGRMRLRPILMTTLTMIFGMMPIALSTSPGAEWKSGLAWGLIGGLTSSLILTLVVVPVVYTTVEDLRSKISNLFKNQKEEAVIAETGFSD